MNMTDQDYRALADSLATPTPRVKNGLWAFGVGGAICAGGQVLHNLLLGLGLEEKSAGTWTTIALIALSAILTGLNLYDEIARHAGAGTLVPVTGFANAIVSPAMDFKSEGFITGMATKMFTIAGPVLVFGLGSSVIYGLILCLFR